MSSFSKVIQPEPITSFVTYQPLQVCGWTDKDDNDDIGSSISIPGKIDVTKKCIDPRIFRPGLTLYIQHLHTQNALLLNKQRVSTPPTNYEYNLANLMNLQFDARKRGDFRAVQRFQQHINNLR